MASVYPGNLGGTFGADIASVTRLATSAPFSRYLAEEIYERSAFIKSGAMATSAALNNTIGTRIEVPFFNSLSTTAETVRSDATWGTSGAGHLTAQKVTAATQYASIMHRGFAYAMDDLSRYQTNEDALNFVRSQMAQDIDRINTTSIISMLTGIVGPGGPLAATNALDVSEPTAGSETEANFLSAATVTAAKYLLGERATSVTTLVVHPTVAAYLEQVGMLQFSSTALATGSGIQWGGGGIGVTNTQVGAAFGLNVVVDSQLPIRGSSGENEQYVCYIMGNGALQTGSQYPLTVGSDYNLLSFQTEMAVKYSNVFHIPGVSWKATSDNPEDTGLATPGNWELVFTEPKLIPVVELTVNSPFGGVLS